MCILAKWGCTVVYILYDSTVVADLSTTNEWKQNCATTLIRYYNYSWNCVSYNSTVLWRSQPINDDEEGKHEVACNIRNIKWITINVYYDWLYIYNIYNNIRYFVHNTSYIVLLLSPVRTVDLKYDFKHAQLQFT